MRYSLDTNVLVDAWRYWYSPSHHPTFWEKLETISSEGALGISDMVYAELEDEDDDLFKWCKARKDILCVPSTEAVQAQMKKIQQAHPNLGTAIPGGKNFADPFVITLAVMSGGGCAVVTHEKATNNMNGPRIPDVCRFEKINVLRLHQIIKAEGWTFQ